VRPEHVGRSAIPCKPESFFAKRPNTVLADTYPRERGESSKEGELLRKEIHKGG
jgi:hypothetical protein